MYGNPSAAYGRTPARQMGALEAFSIPIPAELATFVKRTYGLLAFSVLLGAAACWAMIHLMPTRTILTTRGAVEVSAFPQWGLWLLWGGTFAFSLMGNAVRSGARSGEASPLGLVALAGLVICSGAMLGPTIGLLAGLGMMDVVVAAAATTAVTFTVLTAFVLFTGKNFASMGKFLAVAGIAFIVAGMIGAFFVQSAGFQWWLAAIGAVLFCGFILFHTSSVVHFYGPQNMVVPAVIALYMAIYNLFVMLLYLFASRRGD